MAKDLYESRQMYQSPMLFYIIIPFGIIAILFGFDFFYKIYNENMLKRDTKKVIYSMMSSESVSTYEEYKEFAKNHFVELKYKEEDLDISIIPQENNLLIITYHNYFSMFNELFKRGTKKVAIARFKVYYNEYKETIIEEVDINSEEINETLQEPEDEEEIIIPAR